MVLDTHLLISVLTPFGTEGGRKYCPHLFLEGEETRLIFLVKVCTHLSGYTESYCTLHETGLPSLLGL